MSGKDIREAVGLLAVVAGLVFVAYEIRQNTAATRGQTRQELAALQQEWLILTTADQDFSELLERAWISGGEVAPDEAFRVEYMMLLNMRRLENVFFQYREGLVDESALSSYGFQNMPWSSPRFVDWWGERGWRDAFHPEFVEFAEAQRAAVP